MEAQLKILIQAIRVTKDVESKRMLRATTRETIERMEERKREEDLKRLQEEAAAFVPSGPSLPDQMAATNVNSKGDSL